MILKEWSEAQDIYKATLARWRRAVKTILDPHKLKSYWYVWAAWLFLFLSFTSIVLYDIPDKAFIPQWWTALSLWFITILAGLSVFGATERALAKEFAADYADHGILHYPFSKRRMYFGYVLFLKELEHRKYFHKQVAELSSIAEIATPPEEVQTRLSQHPIVTYIMVLVMALVVNLITTMPGPNPLRVRILNIGVSLLRLVIGVLSSWYPFVNRHKNRHQRIQRYLEWAQRDLEKEQPF